MFTYMEIELQIRMLNMNYLQNYSCDCCMHNVYFLDALHSWHSLKYYIWNSFLVISYSIKSSKIN